jgi:uncharacterized protein (TIGR02145 family)
MLTTLVAIVMLFMTVPLFAATCGDVNGDDKVNLLDISSIIDALYRDGSAMECGEVYTSICGDFNADGKVNLLDISRILNRLYFGGPAMICTEWGEVTDIDGNVYKTVKIGDQWWMAENLKVTHYQNGDEIPHVTNDSIWQSFWQSRGPGAYCEYENDENYVATYGRLYNWYAVEDSRNIAPAGWHVATEAEWQTLIRCLGDAAAAGGKMKEAGTTHWSEPNTGATNRSGFAVLPAGTRSGGEYSSLYYYTIFWSSSNLVGSQAYDAELEHDGSTAWMGSGIKCNGYSIRCIKD